MKYFINFASRAGSDPGVDVVSVFRFVKNTRMEGKVRETTNFKKRPKLEGSIRNISEYAYFGGASEHGFHQKKKR